ncbi:MAG: GTP cyclohydrolase, FolE2/MptA family [Thermodesulfobacteriota bacterium]
MKQAISLHEHERVLSRCLDIPEQLPKVALPLSEVGISGKTVWLRLPEGLIPMEATLEVALPAHRRGIHMSRLEEVIAALYQRPFEDPRQYARVLAQEMLARQEAVSGRVRLLGKIPWLRTAPVSGRVSVDSLELRLDHVCGHEGAGIMLLGVGVDHITACPCTQAYNQVLFHREDDGCPLPTHSQRSHTLLMMESRGEEPAIGELVACLEEALHVSQDLLKRADEAELVLASHAAPQFAEDAVREVAGLVGERFGGRLPDATRVIIESLSLESIHTHDVCCRLEARLAELLGRR